MVTRYRAEAPFTRSTAPSLRLQSAVPASSTQTGVAIGLVERAGLPLLHFNLTKGEVKPIARGTPQMLSGNKQGPSTSKKTARGTS